MNNTALVTGGSGFIGSHVVEELCARGYRVRCFFRPDSSPRWIQHLPVDIMHGTLDDADALVSAVENTDYIFHVAGAVKTVRYRDYYIHNAEGTEHLVQAALHHAARIKRLVFISSQAAAGPADSLEHPKQPLDPCCPISDYGKSKLLAEQNILRVKSKLPITIIRPPCVYGPRDTETLLFFKMIQTGLAVIPGIRTRYTNWIYVKDLARGIVDTAESASAENKIYFLSDGVQYTYPILFRHVGKALGKKYLAIPLPSFTGYLPAVCAELVTRLQKKPSQVTHQKVREGAQRFWVCSCESAAKDFDFSCSYDFPAGLAETTAWYRNQGWL